MKRNSRFIAILMVIVLGMGFSLPGLIYPADAIAASTYSVLSSPMVRANTAGQTLGVIQVDIPNCAAITAGDVLTLTLPAEVTMAVSGAAVISNQVPAGANATGVEVVVQYGAAPISAVVGATRTSLDITFSAMEMAEPGRFLIYITGANIGAMDGDIVATLLGPANSAFSTGTVIVGRIADSGTTTSVQSIKTIGIDGGNTDVITIAETAPGTMGNGDVIKIRLPDGFSWESGIGSPAWGWAGAALLVEPDPENNQILNIMLNGPNVPSQATGGRVDLTGFIMVEEGAQTGDVVAHVFDDYGNVTPADLTIARYGETSAIYRTLYLPAVHADSISNLGVIEVNIPTAASITAGDVLTLSLPEQIKLPGAYEGYANAALLTTGVNQPAGTSGAVEVFVPLNPEEATANGFTPALAEGTVVIEPSRNVLNINFTGAGGDEGGRLFIYLRGADIGAISENVTAAITSTSAALPDENMVVALFSNLSPASGTSYTSLSSPMVAANMPGQNLGVIQVDIANCAAITPGDVLTLTLPAEVKMAASGAAVISSEVPAGANTTGVEVVVQYGLAPFSAMVGATRTSLDITFSAEGMTEPGRFLIYITGADIGAMDGDIVATLLGPSNSAFSTGSVIVGRIAATGTAASISSVKTIGPGGGLTGVISIIENAPATITSPGVIKIKLPNGFTWETGPGTGGAQNWGWTGGAPVLSVDPGDERILNIQLDVSDLPSTSTGGRVDIIGSINVDSSIAPYGDVIAHIYDQVGEVTPTDLLIARHSTYGVNMGATAQPELLAGKSEQTVGNFYIEEELAGSLIPGRTIIFTLPEGANWWGGYFSDGLPVPNVEQGNIALAPFVITNSGTALETYVTAASTTASKISFRNIKLDIAPDMSGPLQMYIGGTAGAAGEVVVADVNPVFDYSSTINHIQKGVQDQLLGDLEITESMPGSIAQVTNALWNQGIITPPVNGYLDLVLPAGAIWSPGFSPDVEVTSGNLQLDVANMMVNNQVIRIPIKYSSTVASTIRITGLRATLDAAVPDGPFNVIVDGTAVNETGGLFPQYSRTRATLAGIGSQNDKLSELTVNGVSVPNFDSTVGTYAINLPLETTEIPVVDAVAEQANAVLTICQAQNLTGTEDERTASVTVCAADGVTVTEYKVIFNLVPSSNGDLSTLNIDGTSIAGFSPDITSYNVKLPWGTTIVPVVTAVPQDDDASVVITAAVNLTGTAADRTSIVTVTPPCGPAKTYQVTFWPARDYLEKRLLNGWNLLSVPLKLQSSALNQIVTEPAKILLAYRYDSGTNSWVELAADAVLNPMDAICLKVSGDTVARLYPSAAISGPYNRALTAGWNLLGPALDISSAVDNKMMVNRFLSSVDSSKYSQVVSQRMGTQNPWTYVPGDSTCPDVHAGAAYWIYMKETANLAGFSYTPVEDVYYQIP